MSSLPTRVLALALLLVLRCLAATWRYRIRGLAHLRDCRSRDERPITMLFHGRLACLMCYFGRPAHRPGAMLVSRSRDGDLITAILAGFGYEAVRGSSSRGGAQAILAIVRYFTTRPSAAFAVTVDGPRGPRERVKPGCIRSAQRCGGHLIALSAAPSRAWVFPSWDRFCLPVPFAQITIAINRPIAVPAQLSGPAFETLRAGAEQLMQRAQQRCDVVAGFTRAIPVPRRTPV